MAKMSEDLIKLLCGIKRLTALLDEVRSSGSKQRMRLLGRLLSVPSCERQFKADPIALVRELREKVYQHGVPVKWEKSVKPPRVIPYFIMPRNARQRSPKQDKMIADLCRNLSVN